MRSRYTAYATRAVDHVMATTAPESPHHVVDAEVWRADLRAWCDAVTFERLEVRSAEVDGDRGVVAFFAHLWAGDRDVSFGERSRFVRRGGRWLYVDGDRLELR